MIPETHFEYAKVLLTEEYLKLCAHLGLSPFTLDIHPFDCDYSNWEPLIMNSFRNGDPNFSSKHKIIGLPVYGDHNISDYPSSPFPFPPRNWDRNSFFNEWPIWRMELWHETIHQVSDHLKVYDPDERGPRGKGHGNGWATAVKHVANSFGINCEVFESVI